MNTERKSKSLLLRCLERVLASLFLWVNAKTADTGYKKEEHLGIKFLIHEDAPDNARHVLLGALYLIKELDPVSFKRIPKYLPDGIIALNDNPYQNAFIRIAKPKAAHVLCKATKSENLGIIALEIIGELCRGRLLALGVGDEKEIKKRIEVTCLRRELFFARRLDTREGTKNIYANAKLGRLERLEQSKEKKSERLKYRRRSYLNTLKYTKNYPCWYRGFLTKRVRKNLKSHPSFKLPSNSGPN